MGAARVVTDAAMGLARLAVNRTIGARGFPLLAAAGAWKVLSILPLGLTVALSALELLVAFLQAYVFAILTCIYLNDALHPGH